MPTTTGKLQLRDYDDSLTARGFEAFSQATRFQMINLGYRYIARAFPWSWEQTHQTYNATQGNPIIAESLGLPGNMSSILRVYLVSQPWRQKLDPETEERFARRWLGMDFSLGQTWGIPRIYYYWESDLYVLPPPMFPMSFTVHFRQYLPDMINPDDTSVMPQVMDEIIIDAALVRAHRRAHELQLANDAQARVDDGVAALLQDDVWEMEELQERTLPDDQWW